jgi:hypothetical protein
MGIAILIAQVDSTTVPGSTGATRAGLFAPTARRQSFAQRLLVPVTGIKMTPAMTVATTHP